MTKKSDKATPKLMLACPTGQHIKSAKLFVGKPGGREETRAGQVIGAGASAAAIVGWCKERGSKA
ncbi:MAG: type VI secretion system tube protein Hcp [Verrucomicrobiales bacterium]